MYYSIHCSMLHSLHIKAIVSITHTLKQTHTIKPVPGKPNYFEFLSFFIEFCI